MHMNYFNIRQNETQFKALTGLSTQEFDQLLERFAPRWQEFIEHHTFNGKFRRKRYSPRGSSLKTHQDRLFFILVYYKNNHLQQQQASMFGMTREMCNKWIAVLEPILLKSLKEFAPKKRFEDLPPQSVCLMDATERPIQRPIYDQSEYYSGKKKRHGVKNLVLASLSGLILWVGATVPAKVHDKTLAENSKIPHSFNIIADLGFLGMQHSHPRIFLPHKKPKNGELTAQQKEENRRWAAVRVKVEHAFASVKRWRIVQEIYRTRDENRKHHAFLIACALHNFTRLHA